MPETKSSAIECLNPNTGRKMKIDKNTYELFSKAIYHVVKAGKAITFTEIVKGVEDCFKQEKTKFNGAIGWYAITVKNDMHARGVLKVFTEKGKKLHSIA